MTKNLLASAISVLLFSSCFKESVNTPPTISDISLSKEKIFNNSEVEISVSATDDDDLNYDWECDEGEIISETNNNTIKLLTSDNSDSCTCSVTVNDGKVSVQKRISFGVYKIVSTDFFAPAEHWITENGEENYANGILNISSSADTDDLVSVYEFEKSIALPYTIYLDAGIANIDDFEPSDKYGILLDFYNSAEDTIVKKLWIRVYPQSDIKNWKISSYIDTGGANRWELLDDDGQGTANFIHTDNNKMNSFKIEIDENNTLSVWVNDTFLYTSSALSNFDAAPPQLRLQKAGVRSTTGTIIVDNFLLSPYTEITPEDISQ